jgi:hypothetical protein
MAQVCLDLHDAIGCKWGDNPYLTISQLKAAAELRRLHSVNAELLDALKLARLVVNPAHAYGIGIEAAIAKAQE